MNRNTFRVPTSQPGSRMPQYNQQQLPATPGADVSARLSDSAGQIMTQGIDQQAKGLEVLGRGMQQAAKAGYDLYNDYQSTKAKEAWLTYKQEADALKAELNTLVGKQAIDEKGGVQARIAQWKQEARTRIAQNLGGPAATMFERAASDVDGNLTNWGVGKAHGEGVNYGNEKSTALIQLRQNEALSNADNPAALKVALQAIDDEISNSMAPRNGWDEAIIKAKQQDIRQKTLVQAISDRIKGEQLGQANVLIGAWRSDLGGHADSLRAQVTAKGRELQARARAESERAEGEAAISAVTGLLKDTAGLSVKDRETVILAKVAEIPDLKMRHRMASLAKSELAFEDLRVTAQTEKQVLDFYNNTKGMTPVQQMRDLETRTDLSDAAREKLRSKLSTDWHRETPQNQAALSDMMIHVDKAKASGQANTDIETAVYARAAARGLTPEQTKKAIKYAQEGGSAGGLKFSEANSIWKRLTGKKEMPVEAFETLRTQLPQGREATTADIERALSNFYMSGKAAGSGWFSDGENYLDSLKHGRGGTWLPNVTDQEKKEIANIMKSTGLVVTLENIRRYKKNVIMGIPEEAGDI